MIDPELSKRYRDAFQEELEYRVAALLPGWNNLQPIKVIKLGLHWVTLLRGERVRFSVFETWPLAINKALQLAAELRKPLASRYAQPI